MQHPDEGMIHTWLDGELSADESVALEAHAATCEQCKAAIAEARGFMAASSRIVSSLDVVPGGVIPVAKPVKRVWYSSPQFRAAAAVLVVAGASLLVMRTGNQKATMAVSTDANRASSAERVMSVAGPSPASSPAPVQPPVVADQASRKVAAPKVATANPAGPQAAREMAVTAAKTATGDLTRKAIANESDFSGKGVKGGSANGVAGSGIRDTGAAFSNPGMKAAEAHTQLRDIALVLPELKVLRVDSSTMMKRTTYQSLSGREVVLTEQLSEIALSEVVVTGVATASPEAEARRRDKSSANSPVVSPPPATPTPAALAPALQNDTAVHNISWVDLSTRRRYSLSGPVSVAELEEIKARLLLNKR